MEYTNLRDWLDAHEVSIDELGRENVADACRDALWDQLVEDAIFSLIQNEPGTVALELVSELPELNPAEVLSFAEHLIKKKNSDWRIFIQSEDGDYDDFYEEHEEEFMKWLKKHNITTPNEPMEYFLSEDIDTFLKFAYEKLGGDHMFDYGHYPNLEDAIDINEFLERFEDEYVDYLIDNLDNFAVEEWFKSWAKDAFDVEEYISPDDYYPVWNYAWEFPSSYDPKELNEAMSDMGLIFFELNGVLYVTLATAGMSMMPALYYAYAIYSDLYIDPKEIAQDIVSHGVGYYKYVIKEHRLAALADYIGYSIEKLNEISKRDYEEFNNLLNKLRNEVDEGKLSRLEAAVIGMATIAHKPDVDRAKIH